MDIVTAEQMRQLDRLAIEQIGLPAMVLMERAGQALAEEVEALLRQLGQRSSGRGEEVSRLRYGLEPWARGQGLSVEPRAPGPSLPATHAAERDMAAQVRLRLGQESVGSGRVLVLAGKGNNGGDGMVALRHLLERGIGCDLLLAEPPDRLKGEAARQFAILRKLGIPAWVWCGGPAEASGSKTADGRDIGPARADGLDSVHTMAEGADAGPATADGTSGANTTLRAANVASGGNAAALSGMDMCPDASGLGMINTCTAVPWYRYGLILDALLGTGTGGPPREPYASLIRAAAAAGLPVLAADIPSGLDTDSGALYEPCLQAVKTVTFGFLKRGLSLYPGAETAGEVVVRAIGIPEQLAPQIGVNVAMLTERMLRGRLGVDPQRTRRPDTHKGSYGHTLVVAGSLRMSGAGLLCTRAALRAGSGLVTWAVPGSLAPHLLGRVPEAMLAGVTDAGQGDWAATSAEDVLALARDRSVLVLGPGMGRYDGDGEWLRAIWEGVRCPLVLDADALNMLAAAGDFAQWPERQAATVLTPHPGEMARLIGSSTAEVQRDRIEVARRFATEHRVNLVLKGARTVIASPEGRIWINPTGNPGMATGGSGDVLAGIIAGHLAQNMSAEQSAAYGVWLHGTAGDRAAARLGSPASLLAGDLLEEL